MAEEKEVKLTEKEQAVLDAISEKIDAQVEQKADKKTIEDMNEKLNDAIKQLTEFKGEINYELMQKQLDKLFERTDQMSMKGTPSKDEKKEREITQKWIKSLLKKDKSGMEKAMKEEAEYKSYFNPSLHTGATTDESATSEQGEYTIPELLLAEINRFIQEAGVARREMRYLPFSGEGNERKLLTLATSVAVSWVDEGGVKPKTKPTIDYVTQKLYKLAAITIMTEEIVEDSAVDLVSLCSELFAEAIAVEEDRVFLAGDIGAGDPVDGVINATGVTAVTMDVGSEAADITPDVLNSMIYEIDTDARRGAKFFMHHSVYSKLQTYRADAVNADDGAGGYLIQRPTDGGPASIWGYPIVLTDQLPATGDVGWEEPFMFFGNLNRTCVYGDKMGLRVKMLDQASITDAGGDLVNLAENDLVAMRVHKRVGYVPVLPAGIAVLSTNTAT